MNKQLFTVFAVFCPCEWMMLDAEYCVCHSGGGGDDLGNFCLQRHHVQTLY